MPSAVYIRRPVSDSCGVMKNITGKRLAVRCLSLYVLGQKLRQNVHCDAVCVRSGALVLMVLF